MNRQQALNQLRLMQAWHEDNGNGPCPDYDAICYAICVIEAQPNGMDTLIKALEAEHKKLLEMQKALKNVPDTNVGDTKIIYCKDCIYKRVCKWKRQGATYCSLAERIPDERSN